MSCPSLGTCPPIWLTARRGDHGSHRALQEMSICSRFFGASINSARLGREWSFRSARLAAHLTLHNWRAGAAHPPGRELHRPGRRRGGEAWQGLAAHAAPQLRLPPGRQGHRSAHHARLPRASRSKAHGALHARRRAPVRGAVEVGVRPPEPADRPPKETSGTVHGGERCQ
jgi:hypothetical protein